MHGYIYSTNKVIVADITIGYKYAINTGFVCAAI